MSSTAHELSTSRAGRVDAFMDAVRTELGEDDADIEAAIESLKGKLRAAGMIFLEDFLGAYRHVVLDVITSPPTPMAATWLKTIERASGCMFAVAAAPSMQMAEGASGAGAPVACVGSSGVRGGLKEHKLSSPTRGNEPLGSWLRKQKKLAGVEVFFKQIGLYHELIEANKADFFAGKPILGSPANVTKFTNLIAMVSSLLVCPSVHHRWLRELTCLRLRVGNGSCVRIHERGPHVRQGGAQRHSRSASS